MLKNGTRLRSQVDETEVIVVRTADSVDDLCCGGAPMVALDAESVASELDPALAGGTVMGKRYVDAAGAELLLTKAGRGTLTIGDIALRRKEAKPLPASD